MSLDELAELAKRLDDHPFDAPAALVAPLAERVLRECAALRERLSEHERAAADPGALLLCIEASAAIRLEGEESYARAVVAYNEAIAIAPTRGQTYFDLSLAHKRRGNWRASLDAAESARELLGNEKRVLWNIAIAATALGLGKTAQDAWRALGIAATVSEGGMPLVEGIPECELRLATRGAGHEKTSIPNEAIGFEIVRVAPLSPCHGVVISPTNRAALADYGDLVLWDGAPVSVRQTANGPVPVFPLLALLRRGNEKRFPFVALVQERASIDAFAAELAPAAEIVVFEERVEHACPRCAAGETLTKHDHAPAEDHRIVRGKVLAGGDADLRLLRASIELAQKRVASLALAIPGLYEALGETALAGKQHQAWAGIERTGVKRLLS